MEPTAVDIPTQLERRRKALTVKELADAVNLSTKQIHELVALRYIPSYSIGGSIRFDPKRVADWPRSQAA
jgi:excisionase family DNA binding protein